MVWICLLRGVNVGGNHKVKMEELRAMFAGTLGYADVRTFIQSGNVVFTAARKPNPAPIEKAFAERFGFHSSMILRNADEMRALIAANPFAGRDFDPSKLLVTFLSNDPGVEAARKLADFDTAGEDLALIGRDLYGYFHNGLGKTKLKFAALPKILGEPGTGRNWNSVLKLEAMTRP
jgi:uncharacterized protein (DUF1697 family)